MNLGRAPHAFFAIVLLVGGWVFFSAFFWKVQSERLDAALYPAAPAIAVSNPGRRLWLDNDSAIWLVHVRDMIEGRQWRVRYTQADNAPYGRDVHWSQSLSWLMLAGGFVRQLFTGQPLFEAVEDAAVWIHSVILFAFMAMMGWAFFRRWGVLAAGFFVGVLGTQPELEWCFQPLRPDHQSLQFVCIMGSMLGLLCGGVSAKSQGVEPRLSPDPQRRTGARRPWIWSGLFAGLALWMGATVTLIAWIPWLCFLAFVVGARGKRAASARAAGWRIWGWTAAGTALLFFFVEYFPFRSAPRGEVNHPLYALSFLLWGEALARLDGASRDHGRGRAAGVLWASVALIPPMLALVAPVASHAMKDPMMRRFHRDIGEFAGIVRMLRGESGWSVPLHFGLLPVAALAGAFRGIRRGGGGWTDESVAGLMAVFFGVLSVVQMRWLPYFAGAAAATAALGLSRLARPVADSASFPRCCSAWRRAWVIVLCLHPLMFAVPAAWRMRQVAMGDAVRPPLMRAALFKRLALGLRAAIVDREPVFMTEPDMAPFFSYYGRIATVASYYWENRDGLQAWSAFFSDVSDRQAALIAVERGLTHVMVARGSSHAMAVQWVVRGKEDRLAAAPMLAARLVGSGPPPPTWLVLNPELTAVGSARYQLKTARRAPRQWNTRCVVFDVRGPKGDDVEKARWQGPARSRGAYHFGQ